MVAKAPCRRQVDQSEELGSAELHLEQPASTNGCKSMNQLISGLAASTGRRRLKSASPCRPYAFKRRLQSAASLMQHEHIRGKLAGRVV